MRQRSLFKKAFFRTSRALGPIEFLPKYDLYQIDIAEKMLVSKKFRFNRC